MKPFDLEVWYGERVAVLGSNGSGKSHFLRLLAAGGSDPDVEHRPVGEVPIAPVRHTGRARLGARVRPGWFVQTHEHPELVGAHAAGRAPPRRRPPGRDAAGSPRPARSTATSWRTPPTRPSARSPAASRRGSRSCCSSCPARPCCCSTSRPTTSTSSRPRRWRRACERVRGHRPGGDPRPLVRPRLRPVPGLRRRRRGLRVRRTGLGRGPGRPRPLSGAVGPR